MDTSTLSSLMTSTGSDNSTFITTLIGNITTSTTIPDETIYSSTARSTAINSTASTLHLATTTKSSLIQNEGINTSLVLRSTILAFFLVTSFTTNILLFIIIHYSRSLRRRSVYRLICNSAIINLFDILVNCTVVIGATITDKWNYAEWTCPFNALTIVFVDFACLFSVFLLAFDRLWSVLHYDSYRRRFRAVPVAIASMTTWAASFALSLPVIVGSSPVKVVNIQGRYSCSVGPESPLSYVLSTLCVGFLLPFIAICALYITILHNGFKESTKRRSLENVANYSAGRVVESPQIWSDINLSKMTGTILAAWIILVGPYTVAVYIDRIENSKSLREVLNPNKSPFASDVVETILFWMRISFSLTMPIITFIYRHDIRKKFRQLVACRNPKTNNLVNDRGTAQVEPGNGTSNKHPAPRLHSGHKGIHNGTDSNDYSRLGSIESSTTIPIPTEIRITHKQHSVPAELGLPTLDASMRVPVIFATSEGLHMHKDEDNQLIADDKDVVNCDVNASRSDIMSHLDEEENNTSDYESNKDETRRNSVFERSISKTSEIIPGEIAETLTLGSTTRFNPSQTYLTDTDGSPKPERKKKKSDGKVQRFEVSDVVNTEGQGKDKKSKERRKKRRKKSDLEMRPITADTSINSQSHLLTLHYSSSVNEKPTSQESLEREAKKKSKRRRNNSVEPPRMPKPVEEVAVPQTARQASVKEDSSPKRFEPLGSDDSVKEEEEAKVKPKKRRSKTRTLPPLVMQENSAFRPNDT